jgi:hypothetical protein
MRMREAHSVAQPARIRLRIAPVVVRMAKP